MADISRRQFFKLGFGDALKEVFDKKPTEGKTPQFFPLRPPGAIQEASFVSECERCGACADACSYKAIFKFGPAYGALEYTPYMKPSDSPCRWCKDFACIKACPSGALKIDAGKQPQKIGLGQIDFDQCLTSHGTLCDD